LAISRIDLETLDQDRCGGRHLICGRPMPVVEPQVPALERAEIKS
jgi:hypothetical protein